MSERARYGAVRALKLLPVYKPMNAFVLVMGSIRVTYICYRFSSREMSIN